MMGPGPLCYIQKFMEIGPLVPEKKIFEGFLTIYGRGSHLDHNTISFPCTKKHTYEIWLKMAQWFLRKASFDFHM